MTSALDDIFQPPETRAGKIRRLRRRISFGTVVVVLAVVIGWLTLEKIHTCGSSVYQVDGECVGVTDGSYHFDPAFTDIEGKIASENAAVRVGASSYVTVALLDLLTPTSTSAESAANIRNELEGAYTAQQRYNDELHNTKKIQLVLANQGDTDAQWQQVSGRLVEMTKGANPLVAVIGLGVSTTQTQQRAKDLSSYGIPMVGSGINADELDYTHIPGLIRVSPANLDFAEALRPYVDAHNKLRSAVMVYDSNSDSRGDLFTQSLRDDLQKKFQYLINGRPSLSFVGASIPTPDDPDTFDVTVTPNLCGTPPTDVVFYAGREVDLGGFLDSLAGRQCRATPLTVITAADIGDLLSKREQQLRTANLTVVYAGTSYAQGWGHGVAGTPQYYRDFLTVFRRYGFHDEDLVDGEVIEMHDAFLTAADAVGLVTASDPSPTAAKVASVLLNLNGAHPVQGASGTLSFSFRQTGAGNPINKPVPVLTFPSPPDEPYGQQVVMPVYLTP
ncbi:MAG: hypothetical protein ABIZ05_09735 [Pseudonocardiaceae bacterium]